MKFLRLKEDKLLAQSLRLLGGEARLELGFPGHLALSFPLTMIPSF